MNSIKKQLSTFSYKQLYNYSRIDFAVPLELLGNYFVFEALSNENRF